jgi:hypothetical protein
MLLISGRTQVTGMYYALLFGFSFFVERRKLNEDTSNFKQ